MATDKEIEDVLNCSRSDVCVLAVRERVGVFVDEKLRVGKVFVQFSPTQTLGVEDFEMVLKHFAPGFEWFSFPDV